MYRAQNKVIKWTTAWERWMNQQTFSLQLLFKTRPCKTSWQAVYFFYLRRANALTVNNCICKYTSLLWNNSVVILNTYCCDHASVWFDLNPAKTCLSGQRKTFCKSLIFWMIRYYCHSHACVVLEQFFVCLPGLCAIRHWIENAF